MWLQDPPYSGVTSSSVLIDTCAMTLLPNEVTCTTTEIRALIWLGDTIQPTTVGLSPGLPEQS